MTDSAGLKFCLTVFNDFRAAHSLEGFETPHFHLFKVSAGFEVPYPINGDRVIDLIYLQKILDCSLYPLHNKDLNSILKVSPTSENLCVWLWEELSTQLPDAPLKSVSIELCDLEGRAMGKATLGR
jgi:6-pyruvoyl-tetrahydropterin synthase